MMGILARITMSALVERGLAGSAAAGDVDATRPAISTPELGYAVSGSKGMRLSRFVEPSSEEAGVPDSLIVTPPGVMSETQTVITGASGSGAPTPTRSAGTPMLGDRGVTLDQVLHVLPAPRPLDNPVGEVQPAASAMTPMAAAPMATPQAVSQSAKRKTLRIAGADTSEPALKRVPIVIGAFR